MSLVKIARKLKMNILSRKCINFSAFQQTIRTLNAASTLQIKIKIVPPEKPESFGTRNRRLGRLFSPSLSIYKPQLTSMLSITNRTSSILITLYTWSLGVGALISSHDNAHFATMLEGLNLGSTCLLVLKFMIAFPFAYHVCASTRVLIWETGNFLSLQGIYISGYVALASSFLTAIVLACL